MRATFPLMFLATLMVVLGVGVAAADECSILATEESQACFFITECIPQCRCLLDVDRAHCECLRITGVFDQAQTNACLSNAQSSFLDCRRGCLPREGDCTSLPPEELEIFEGPQSTIEPDPVQATEVAPLEPSQGLFTE